MQDDRVVCSGVDLSPRLDFFFVVVYLQTSNFDLVQMIGFELSVDY